MNDHSRRGFLAIAGAGAAGVAVAGLATAGKAAAATPTSAPEAGSASTATLPSGASGPLVAYVGDLRDGQISVMAGEREVVIRDRELVARLARAVAE